MSSLLQSNQPIDRRGCGILVYLTRGPECYSGDLELFLCSKCKRLHAQLYRIFRKPAGMFGCWVLFRVNGESRAIDHSTPTQVTKLPPGAEPVDSAVEWHRE